MSTEKQIKRGYVKWTDDDGVFHKEPLVDHPELLAKATPEQQLAAEEVRRLNEEGERRMREYEEDSDVEKTLEVLKEAPPEVLTASMLATDEQGEPVPELAVQFDGDPVTSSEMNNTDNTIKGERLTVEQVRAQPEER